MDWVCNLIFSLFFPSFKDECGQTPPSTGEVSKLVETLQTDFQEKGEKLFYFFLILSTITPHLWTKKDFTWCHNLANYFLKGRSNILPFDQ